MVGEARRSPEGERQAERLRPTAGDLQKALSVVRRRLWWRPRSGRIRRIGRMATSSQGNVNAYVPLEFCQRT
jgi:hypothetical protein